MLLTRAAELVLTVALVVWYLRLSAQTPSR
jgi:hypothetical protein